MGSTLPQPSRFPIPKVGPLPVYLATGAAALRFGNFLCRHIDIELEFLSHSSCKKHSLLGPAPRLKDAWHEWLGFNKFDLFQLSNNAVSATCSSCLCLFSGKRSKHELGDGGSSYLETPKNSSSNKRQWTNILLAINVVVYVAQIATQGKLMLWGAKINSLIDKGQFWRLATSSLLHANIGHLMVNCYSLNSVGPTMENISGPKRYFAVYFTSAIASSLMSYWFCRAPAVGASGAIFGLVGSVGVFVLRHRSLVGGGKEDLQQIAHVIVLNMVIGLLSKGIDNWGHLGGLLGGAATSWLLGPAWKYEASANDGRRVFADRAPIFYLFNKKTLPW